MQPREPLYDRIDRLVRERWALALLGILPASRLLIRAYFDYLDGDTVGMLVAVGLTVACVAVVLGINSLLGRNRRSSWHRERILSAGEIAVAKGREVTRLSPEGARIRKGDFPAFDRALDLYHAAVGRRVYPRIERLPQAVYGARLDACTRLDKGEAVLCLTPALLDSYKPGELLAVLVHLIRRGEGLKSVTARSADCVREADAKTLMLTKDHDALLSAIEKTRAQTPPGLAKPGDAEAWFSEDDAEPSRYSRNGTPIDWKRIDRLAELRTHLGALGIETSGPGAPRRWTEGDIRSALSKDERFAERITPGTLAFLAVIGVLVIIGAYFVSLSLAT